MDMGFTQLLYVVTAVLMAVSFYKDQAKTILSLKKAWRMFRGVLPQFAAILLLVGVLLVLVETETIEGTIGAASGLWGMLISSLAGAVALIPALIAFPIAAELIGQGAGVAQMAVFISTLTTVGLVTLPLEAKYLGWKVAVLRNFLFYLFSFITALVLELVLTP